MLHVLCYLNEEVDCDIAVTSMSAFILASICSVLSAVSMLVSLIQIRADNLRSRFRQAKRKGLQEPVSEHCIGQQRWLDVEKYHAQQISA